MKDNILYLGSQSKSRQVLLKKSGIAFRTLRHHHDERILNYKKNIQEIVKNITKAKMQSLKFPSLRVKANQILVVTADTLVYLPNKKLILGKPVDLADAIRMISIIQDKPVKVITGCMVASFVKEKKNWKQKKTKIFAVTTAVEFYIPTNSITKYLNKTPTALKSCGAGVIEGFGAQFLKSVNGSYSSVLGLPMFELRKTLLELGFKF